VHVCFTKMKIKLKIKSTDIFLLHVTVHRNPVSAAAPVLPARQWRGSCLWMHCDFSSLVDGGLGHGQESPGPLSSSVGCLDRQAKKLCTQ
jgi:hypothetical protein